MSSTVRFEREIDASIVPIVTLLHQQGVNTISSAGHGGGAYIEFHDVPWARSGILAGWRWDYDDKRHTWKASTRDQDLIEQTAVDAYQRIRDKSVIHGARNDGRWLVDLDYTVLPRMAEAVQRLRKDGVDVVGCSTIEETRRNKWLDFTVRDPGERLPEHHEDGYGVYRIGGDLAKLTARKNIILGAEPAIDRIETVARDAIVHQGPVINFNYHY